MQVIVVNYIKMTGINILKKTNNNSNKNSRFPKTEPGRNVEQIL